MTQSQTYKVSRDETQPGKDGERHLIAGENGAMRLWHDEQPSETADKAPRSHDYETLGYVISGQVELTVGGQTVTLSAGDSYRVPRGAEHVYRVTETLTAVEVTTPATNK